MSFKPGMVVLDAVSGWVDAAIAEALGDDPKPYTYTALKYNTAIMGPWHRDFRVLREIQRRHGISIGVVGHVKHHETWRTTGYDTKGQPIRDGNADSWMLDIPGGGEKGIRAAFSEVWHLTTVLDPSGAVINPNRKLITQPYMYDNLRFEAKTRKGIPTGIINPTWDKVIKELPAGKSEPETILLLGVPGVGKTTFFESALAAKKSILWFDLMGGCEEVAKKEGHKVLFPTKVGQVFEVLKTLRDKGELPN